MSVANDLQRGAPRHPHRLRVTGAILIIAAIVTVWTLRVVAGRPVYVSELGATGVATAPWFNASLLGIAVGGTLIALGTRPVRSTTRWLSAWPVAATLVFACVMFALASQVTCTPGCPVPFTSGSTVQDLVHTSSAVLGFAAGGYACIQVAFLRHRRRLARISATAGISMLVVASVGGLLSVAQLGTEIGGVLEFTAMTIALAWLAIYGLTATDADAAPAVEPSLEVSGLASEPA